MIMRERVLLFLLETEQSYIQSLKVLAKVNIRQFVIIIIIIVTNTRNTTGCYQIME